MSLLQEALAKAGKGAELKAQPKKPPLIPTIPLGELTKLRPAPETKTEKKTDAFQDLRQNFWRSVSNSKKIATPLYKSAKGAGFATASFIKVTSRFLMQALGEQTALISKYFMPLAGISFLALAMVILFVLKPFQLSKATIGSTSISEPDLSTARMKSIVTHLDTGPKFQLTGITTADGQELALINNQVVGVGDITREKALVKRIQNRSVILEFRGREISLSL